jgi:FixJ family two-component response regulator
LNRNKEHERIALLQLRERAVLAAVVRQLVVGKTAPENDVSSHIYTGAWSPLRSM